MAIGVLNRHLQEMAEGGYVRVVDRDVRPFAYKVTPNGKRYRRKLILEHYQSVVGSLRAVEQRISARLDELKRKGVERVVFYGAGDVMEIAYPVAHTMGLTVIGVVDDDPGKHGSLKDRLVVQPPGMINTLEPHAVVITTFRHAREIQRKIDPSLRSVIQVWEL